MASSTSTSAYPDGHPSARLPNAFTSVPQQSTSYSNTAFPEHTSAFQSNQEGDQYGSSDAWMNSTSGSLGPGYYYPQDLTSQYQGWFSPEQAFKRRNDTKRLLQQAGDMDPTGMFYSEDMSRALPTNAETTLNRQSLHAQNIQGVNVFQQQINHFGGAAQFAHSAHFPQLENFHHNSFVSNFTNGYGNHIADATARNGAAQQYLPQLQPPPYQFPPPGHLPPFHNPLQANDPPQNNTLVPHTPVLEDAIPRPPRATKTKGKPKTMRNQKAKATSRTRLHTQHPASSNRAQITARGPTQAPSYTNLPHAVAAPLPPMIAPGVPQPAERLVANSSVQKRARDPNQIYGTQIADRPPHNVMPPRNIDISMLEICTFFPSWFLLPEVAMRAQANGWDRKEIAKAHLNARNALYSITNKEFNRAQNRIQKHFSGGGKAIFHIPLGRDNPWSKEYVVNSAFPKDNLSAVNWRFKSDHLRSKKQDQWGHISLKDIYRHVPPTNWPQGADRMILTRCLEYAYNNQQLDLDTSHISWIMHTQNLVQGPRQTSQHDKDALTRFKASVPDR